MLRGFWFVVSGDRMKKMHGYESGVLHRLLL